MSQKLLHGGAEPSSRAATIREIYEQQLGGQATIAMLVDAVVAAGVFESSVEEAILALAKRECKRVLKEEDAQGLNYAGPVQETPEGMPVWIQRQLWNEAEYRVNDAALYRQEAQTHDKRMKYRDEAQTRFGAVNWNV